jgi:epsilon-lactone hydrolase
MSVRVPREVARLGARQVGRHVLNPRLPWAVQRRRLERVMESWPLPRGTSVTTTAWNGVPGEIVTAGQGSAATVVHFHGGGYCVGSPAQARDWAAHLSARAGCRVLLPRYRLAPEHPYPAALDDARAVLSAVLDGTAASIVVSGDSAGGGLALAALGALGALGASEAARVGGCVLLSPWLDLTVDRTAVPGLVRRDIVLSPAWLEACARAYAPPADWAGPSISPLRARLDGLPALLIQCGTDDLLAPDAENLAVRAAAAGVDVTYSRWPGLWHDFALQPGMTAAARDAVTQAAWFVGRTAAP